MSTTVTFNGANFVVPAIGDASWGSNVSNYLIAIASGALQKSGGAFTLTAEVNFGGTFGLNSIYFKSNTINPASTGAVRLAKTDTISFRNNANTSDIPLGIDGSNLLQFNSIDLVDISTAQTLSNKTFVSLAGTLVDITHLGLRDTSAGFDVVVGATSSVTLTAPVNLTLDMQNASFTLKVGALSRFSTLTDGTAGQILSTLGSNSGYAWASALSSTLAQFNTFIGNSSNVGTATNTNLLGDILAKTNQLTATVTIATPGVVTATAHGLSVGDVVYFTTTGALPTGLTASTSYWVNNVTTNTFQLSSSYGNAIPTSPTSITTSGTQSGTHTVFSGGLQSWKKGTRGVIDGSSAAAGIVGEVIQSIDSPGGGTPAAPSNSFLALTSITLTPGDWNIYSCAVLFYQSSVTLTVGNQAVLAISTTSASNAGCTTGYDLNQLSTQATSGFSAGEVIFNLTAYKWISLSVTTTFYMNVFFQYGGSGTPTWQGSISARRMR